MVHKPTNGLSIDKCVSVMLVLTIVLMVCILFYPYAAFT